MKNLPNHIRNYELVERKCEDLFEFLLISDQQLKTQTTGLLLLDIVPCIESLAKDLHQELSPQFPDLPQFKDGEPFDYAALAFLDRALGLSKKQVKITSKLIPSLSEERRLITPLFGAHESKDKHPLWSKAYQSNKHDLANSQNADLSDSSLGGSIPSTIQAEIEAAGAFFLLLCVAKSLPLNKQVSYGNFDLKFGSNIFQATYVRPFFTNFTRTLDNSSLQMSDKWQESLFLVKEPEGYIITLRKKSITILSQIKQELCENLDFLAFYANLPEDQKNNTIEYILFKYSEATGNSTQDSLSLLFQTHNEYLSNWINQDIALMRLNRTEPVVVLNTYKDNDPIYDYDKINNS